jgi:predicted transcriptional regulator
VPEKSATGLDRTAAQLPITTHAGVCLSSVEAARRLLTPHRLAMLRTIRSKHPRSIYELAKVLGRDLKNVQADLRLLEKYGLVRTSAGRGTGRRKVRIPHVRFDEISLKVAI